jgi:hypothetical protein
MLTSGLIALASGGLATLATPGAAAPSGGACQLTGTANFSPAGPGANTTFGYTFSGALTQCKSNASGAPASGTIGAGQTYTEPVTITTSTGSTSGTASYVAPAATGSGDIPVNSCPAGKTAGTAIATWPDGTSTVASYTTQSVAAGVELSGTVVPSVDLTLVPGSESPAGTAPATFTLPSNNPSFPTGDGVEGALAFTTSTPQQCTSASGLSSVSIQGLIGLGSTS